MSCVAFNVKKKVITISLFLVALFVNESLFAQNGVLMLHGKVVNKGSSLGGVTVEIISDQVDTIRTFTTPNNGSYKVNVPLGTVYSISFYKEGYVTKSIGVIGKALREVNIDGRYFYQLDIELYLEGNDREDETMIPPVAKLYIEDPKKGFTFDKQYVKWVQEEYREILE